MKKVLPSRRRVLAGVFALAVGLALSSSPAAAGVEGETVQPGKKPVKVSIAVSIYTGWMPWYLADSEGILQKWGERYGYEFELNQCVDYPTSFTAYTSGDAQALAITNTDILTLGVPSTVIIMGDYSDGNDALISRDGLKLTDLPGGEVALVENSVSHLLLWAACVQKGIDFSKVEVLNTSDANIGPGFLQTKSMKFVATWNPIVLQIMQARGNSVLFSSRDIPGWIQDALVMNDQFLHDHPDAAEALTGAWYETLGLIHKRSSSANEYLERMAEMAANTPDEFRKQLETTHMFWNPADASAFTASGELPGYNAEVLKFLALRELLGMGEDGKPLTAAQVGIRYPDGTVQGDEHNVMLTYTTEFMNRARDGKLKK